MEEALDLSFDRLLMMMMMISLTARFSGIKLLKINCVFWFFLQLLYETFFILRIIQRHMIKNVNLSPCKVYVILLLF